MSVAKVFTCDRCDHEARRPETGGLPESWCAVTITYPAGESREHTRTQERFDLCDRCSNDAEQFFAGGPLVLRAV